MRRKRPGARPACQRSGLARSQPAHHCRCQWRQCVNPIAPERCRVAPVTQRRTPTCRRIRTSRRRNCGRAKSSTSFRHHSSVPPIRGRVRVWDPIFAYQSITLTTWQQNQVLPGEAPHPSYRRCFATLFGNTCAMSAERSGAVIHAKRKPFVNESLLWLHAILPTICASSTCQPPAISLASRMKADLPGW